MLFILVSGCETSHFYGQATKGQFALLANRTPVSDLLSSESVSPDLKARLELTQRLIHFAETELSLPHCGNYQKYTELDRPYVVWNVYATPKYSMVDKEWWYPIVGSMSYRGYFKEKHAIAYAHKLEKKGLDVFVGGVVAYSTLGFFNDPLLSTFIQYNEPDLAELIFHELAHSKKFLKGDTDFNEAFATAVAQEGARRWLLSVTAGSLLERFEKNHVRHRQFVDLVISTKNELEELFKDATGKPDAEDAIRLEHEKQKVYESMQVDYLKLKESWDDYSGFDRWMALPINNAQINTVTTYYELEPALTRLIQNSDSFEDFFEKAEIIASLKKDQRHDPTKWPF
ncbi:aminopeptidase [Verrucomicrobia bacterium]|nr:aminopeptidase [Verrucomicrobiota bacterium]